MLNHVERGHSAAEYLDEITFSDYLKFAETNHPSLYAMLDQRHLAGDSMEHYVHEMNSFSWEFEGSGVGGRGQAYNVAQKATHNRRLGMIALLQCFSPSFDRIPGNDCQILDVLGGDGTIARFVETIDGPKPRIITADLSKYMVSACYRQDLPCIRQSATRSLFSDNTLDGILIAYGSHHLDAEARQVAVMEAHRTLKPGGRLVLHDFETGERSAKWFEDIVHPYSRTGHPHPHFSRREMFELFTTAGFRDVRIFDLNDPFTLYGGTHEEARRNAVMHMYHIYDLVKIANSEESVLARVEQSVIETLGQIIVGKGDDAYVATIPRRALVAVGTKA